MSSADDQTIRQVLENVRSIAVVGFSANPSRASHYVAEFLRGHGYRVIPVNPGLAGQTFLGETVRASLAEIGGPVDMVDVFRAAEAVPAIMDEAIAIGAKVVWTQLDIRHEEAAAKGRAASLTVVMDRCPKIEIPRLGIRTPA